MIIRGLLTQLNQIYNRIQELDPDEVVNWNYIRGLIADAEFKSACKIEVEGCIALTNENLVIWEAKDIRDHSRIKIDEDDYLEPYEEQMGELYLPPSKDIEEMPKVVEKKEEEHPMLNLIDFKHVKERYSEEGDIVGVNLCQMVIDMKTGLEQTIDIKESAIDPSHYNQLEYEPIKVMADWCKDCQGIEAIYMGNVIRYIARWKHKNGIEDLKKAERYLTWLIEYEEGK